MFLAVLKNGQNKKTLGLVSQPDQRGWRRECTETRGSRAIAGPAPYGPDVRTTRGSMEAPQPAPRDRVPSPFSAVLCGDRKWAASLTCDLQDDEEDPMQAHHPLD